MGIDEIKVGEYIRTPDGEIGVVTCTELLGPEIFTGTKYLVLAPEGIKTHSKNIIDLIEVGDYVNGVKVIEVGKYNFKTIEEYGLKINYKKSVKIKSIVTHEQFEAMKYKVEE